MTPNAILLSIGAGLIAAIVFASAATGPLVARFVFYFLTPLPLFLAGLGLSPLAAIIAAATATAAVLFLANPVAALVFAVSSAAPAAILSRQALLARGEGETREWFPLGSLVATAAFYGGLSALLILILLGGDVAALTKSVETFVTAFIKTDLPAMPGAPVIDEKDVPEIAQILVRLLPGVLAVSSMGALVFALWLAGRITFASGRLTRPWPDLSALDLPSTATFVLLAALALTLTGGFAGIAAGAFAGSYTFAFVILGLALAHALTKGSPWRPFILTGLYVALFAYSLQVATLLALAGLGEKLFGYRQALSRGPPPGHA